MSTNRNREELAPMTRNRSSSANEASKPVLVMQRRQTHGSKTLNFSPSNGGSVAGKFFRTFLHFFLFTFIYTISSCSSLVGNYSYTLKSKADFSIPSMYSIKKNYKNLLSKQKKNSYMSTKTHVW